MTTNNSNFNFYDALYKSLDDDSDDESNLCQISGCPLEENTAVTLNCKHKFNYVPLYKEICRQKYDFRSYDWHALSLKEKRLVRKSNYDYFIRCPYCRSIEFTVLPYYNHLGLKMKYGVNSTDSSLCDNSQIKPYSKYRVSQDSSDNPIVIYGKLYKKGVCDEVGCKHEYVTLIPETELKYCQGHYKDGLNKIKLEKEKEKKELLDKLNQERNEKGLKPLKRLPNVNKPNVIQTNIEIKTYTPEMDNVTDSVSSPVLKINGCKALLKTGPNKGKACGCAKIQENGLCKRHQEKDKS